MSTVACPQCGAPRTPAVIGTPAACAHCGCEVLDGSILEPGWIAPTEAALAKLRAFLGEHHRQAVRIDIEKDAFPSLDLDHVRAGDRTFEVGGVSFIFAPDLAALVRGLAIDWQVAKDGAQGFTFGGKALILDRSIAARALPRPKLS